MKTLKETCFELRVTYLELRKIMDRINVEPQRSRLDRRVYLLNDQQFAEVKRYVDQLNEARQAVRDEGVV